MSIKQLKAEIEKLSPQERFELEQELLGERYKPTREQEEEIMRRAGEIEKGTVELGDGNVVDAEAEAILNEAG